MHNMKKCFLILFQLYQIRSYENTSKIINDNHVIQIPIQDKSCADFVNPKPSPDEEYTLQSPNYPDQYPVNLDCVHVIKAPKSGMTIRLEFRENFELEEKYDCSNDFLQINDGPFGFSKMITKLCGKEIAKETIQSSGPYLWLRFHSDKSLAGQGFKFVYRFVSEKENGETAKICYRKLTIPNSRSYILNSDYLKDLRPTSDFKTIEECVFDISVSVECNIYISVVLLNVTGMSTLRQKIEIYDRITDKIKISKYKNYFILDENSNIDKIFVKHQRAVVRIMFKNIESIMNFKFVLTALVNQSKAKCQDDEYTCEGKFCISNELVCNKIRNCPDGDDEICRPGKPLQNAGSFMTQTTAESGKKAKSQEKDHQQLHGFILGAITLFLLCMLVGCIIHSVKQSKANSKSNKTPVKNVIAIDDDKLLNLDDKEMKPVSSTVTLTTDMVNKKLYTQPKPKVSTSNRNRVETEPVSIIYKDFSFFEGDPQYNSPYIPNFNYCSPGSDHLSQSISNVDQCHNHGTNKHLPDCTSLPNFSTESVKNLFGDENYPIIEEITIMKPVRVKYYA